MKTEIMLVSSDDLNIILTWYERWKGTRFQRWEREDIPHHELARKIEKLFEKMLREEDKNDKNNW